MKKSFIPIDQFRIDELKHLIKQFAEEKVGTLVISNNLETKKENEETIFSARLKERSTKRFWVEGKSVDAHHAKDKLINKLREKLHEERIGTFLKAPDFKKELQEIAA